jgi:hypothetical protein
VTIPRNRAEGGYAGTTTIASAEFEHFDKYLSEAVHGQGGTYVLTQPLILGGDNFVVVENVEVGGALTVTGATILNGDVDIDASIDITGNAAVGGTLDIGGTASFGAGVDITGAVLMHSSVGIDGALSVAGDVTFSDDLTVEGLATFSDSVIFDDTTTFNAAASFEEDVYFNGTAFVCQSQAVFFEDVTLRNVVSFADAGKIVYRQKVVATDANQTVLAAQVDSFIVPAGVFSANREVTIDDTGAANGMRIHFISYDASNHCTVLRPGGGAGMGSFGGASGQMAWAERINGVWEMQQSDE